MLIYCTEVFDQERVIEYLIGLKNISLIPEKIYIMCYFDRDFIRMKFRIF